MSDDHPYPIEPVSRDWLEQSVDYALRHKVRLPMVGPRKARWKNDGESRIAAQAIVDHLELCGVRLVRPVMPVVPPQDHHYPHGRPAEDKAPDD